MIYVMKTLFNCSVNFPKEETKYACLAKSPDNLASIHPESSDGVFQFMSQ